jgi:trk system potassium uptake protein
MEAARAPEQKSVQPRQPARTLVLLFLFAIMGGTALLQLPICAREGPIDLSTALFTATSAVCVTGLVVVDTATAYSWVGQAIILLLIQIGALGYMTASTVLVLILGRQPDLYSRLLLRETLGQVTLSDTRRLLFHAVGLTFAAEAVGALILTARFAMEPGRGLGEAAWRGVFHAVSAFCNAGFDLFGLDGHAIAGLGKYQGDWIVNFTVMALIIIGGLGFPVWAELLYRRRGRPLTLHTRIVLVMSAALILVGFLGVLVAEWTNPGTLRLLPLHQKLLAALFQSVTTRTAGFATVDFADLRSITLLGMGVLMFIGASPGGTGGGVKTTTASVILSAIRASVYGKEDAEIHNRRIAAENVYRALVLFLLSFAFVVVGMFLLTTTEPDALMEAGFTANLFVQIQFEAISAFGTVGLSTGITPYLTDTGRVVIIILMFIGRLGPITVATALAKRGPVERRRLPEERVALG